MDLVRDELSEILEKPLIPEMEMHYVRYPVGGFFRRHIDEFVDEAAEYEGEGIRSRRCVSWICYLTEPDWTAADGGQLISFDGSEPTEFLPTSGSLVLFDSLAVEHEVRPTQRERDCLVGWFHTLVV